MTGAGGRVVGFGRSCIKCGHCGAYCPANAFGLEKAGLPRVSGDDLMALFISRRSSRTFLPEPPSLDEIEHILAPVGFAPTGTNSQGVTVVVIRGAERIRELAVKPLRRLAGPFLPLAAAVGFRRQTEAFRSGADPILRGAPCLLLFFVPWRNTTPREDGHIAACMVSLQAQAMGIGSLWNGVLKALFPLLAGLRRTRPRGTRLQAVLCIGRTELDPVQCVPERQWNKLVL